MVQTWLVHGDLIGGIAAWICNVKNIVWNVRYSNLEVGKVNLTTILIVKILTKLSFYIPKSIVIVSKKASKIYEIQGYDKNKIKFIPNGYDLSVLKPNFLLKERFQQKMKANNFSHW